MMAQAIHTLRSQSKVRIQHDSEIRFPMRYDVREGAWGATFRRDVMLSADGFGSVRRRGGGATRSVDRNRGRGLMDAVIVGACGAPACDHGGGPPTENDVASTPATFT